MNKKLTPLQVKSFRRQVNAFYRRNGRVLPWRKAKPDPYAVFVSEIMLQQTQVDRAQEKYRPWLKRFPTWSHLAAAPSGAVIAAWQGLGYNRRAVALQRAAQAVISQYHGQLPRDQAALEALPGVGPYTAAAIRAFAFNQPAVVIETNIRAVYIHHFFPMAKKVTDDQLRPLIEQTLDWRHPARWYSALMDYGTMLKKQHPNPTRRSHHYVRQSAFVGSNRQVRGAVVRHLTQKGSATARELARQLPFSLISIDSVVSQLIKDGLIHRQGSRLVLG